MRPISGQPGGADVVVVVSPVAGIGAESVGVDGTVVSLAGRVVTVVPSAMMNVEVSGSRSPVVVVPRTVIVHSPGARSVRPASGATNAPPGRVIGTVIEYPENAGFAGTKSIVNC